MACDECRDLNSHVFRSPEDLLHALQVAAAELDRGVLKRLDEETRTSAQEEAMRSVIASESLPETVRYRFECLVCGDRFVLAGDVGRGTGEWTRIPKAPIP
jgi:hypothetical protein